MRHSFSLLFEFGGLVVSLVFMLTETYRWGKKKGEPLVAVGTIILFASAVAVFMVTGRFTGLLGGFTIGAGVGIVCSIISFHNGREKPRAR